LVLVQSLRTTGTQAYYLLASAERDGHAPAAAPAGDEASTIGRALELTVVTAALTPLLVERLLQRTQSRRPAALVFVDPASFGPNGPRPAPRPDLLRLQASGVPVAVIQRGDDLTAKLAGEQVSRVAHG